MPIDNIKLNRRFLLKRPLSPVMPIPPPRKTKYSVIKPKIIPTNKNLIKRGRGIFLIIGLIAGAINHINTKTENIKKVNCLSSIAISGIIPNIIKMILDINFFIGMIINFGSIIYKSCYLQKESETVNKMLALINFTAPKIVKYINILFLLKSQWKYKYQKTLQKR